ncbi:hypothetical protein AAHA92_09730 [Salvia divinorum]|uniref:Uncharacterized protein n=1 Tax=Salvia divinorum TaxID=28513 RepID=A0ABD1HSE4_SALDI
MTEAEIYNNFYEGMTLESKDLVKSSSGRDFSRLRAHRCEESLQQSAHHHAPLRKKPNSLPRPRRALRKLVKRMRTNITVYLERWSIKPKSMWWEAGTLMAAGTQGSREMPPGEITRISGGLMRILTNHLNRLRLSKTLRRDNPVGQTEVRRDPITGTTGIREVILTGPAAINPIGPIGQQGNQGPSAHFNQNQGPQGNFHPNQGSGYNHHQRSGSNQPYSKQSRNTDDLVEDLLNSQQHI